MKTNSIRTSVLALFLLTWHAALLPATGQDCVRWVRRTDVGNSGFRRSHVMAYDSDRGVTVLFGGENIEEGLFSDTTRNLDDTWEYDGIAWRPITVDGPSPDPRSWAAMCYDTIRREMVMVGGINGDGYRNDTWTYRPAGSGHGVWTRRQDLGSAFSGKDDFERAAHAMVFDLRNGVAVVFGGTAGDDTSIGSPGTFRSSEVWEWNGGSWSFHGQLFQATDRGFRGYEGPTRHGMAYDSDTGLAVVGGGAYYQYQGAFDRWIDFDSNSLFPIYRINSFPTYRTDQAAFSSQADFRNRQQHAMAYDSNRKRIVIFGGRLTMNCPTCADPGDAHTEARVLSTEPNGNVSYGARTLTLSQKPPARERFAMVYDSFHQKVILYGGSRGDSLFNDTWELEVVPLASFSLVPPNGRTCTGSPLTISALISDTRPMTYQWFVDDASGKDVPIPDQTRQDLSLSENPYSRTHRFTLQVEDECGNRFSRSVDVRMFPQPVLRNLIVSDKLDQCPGGSISFSAQIDSEFAVALQWYHDGVAIPGATVPELSLKNLRHEDTGRYHLAISSDCGTLSSETRFPIHLQVGVTISVQPVNQAVAVCTSADFSVEARGVGTLRYQWRINGRPVVDDANVSGANTNRVSIRPVLYKYEGQWDVVITDDCGDANAVTSRVATLTITPGPQWVLRTTNGPTARLAATMAYDSQRKVTVLFGGLGLNKEYPGQLVMLNDVWEWDGVRWVQRVPLSFTNGWTHNSDGSWSVAYTRQPVYRHSHSMAYDSTRGRVVLFGGRSYNPGSFTVDLNDTWEWDGAQWLFRATNGPSPRVGTRMAYDNARGVCVLFGGSFDSGTQGPWEWNGQQWRDSNWNGDPPPNVFGGAAMTFDPGSGRTFFGPTRDGFSILSKHFWWWDGARMSFATQGPPPGGVAHLREDNF